MDVHPTRNDINRYWFIATSVTDVGCVGWDFAKTQKRLGRRRGQAELQHLRRHAEADPAASRGRPWPGPIAVILGIFPTEHPPFGESFDYFFGNTVMALHQLLSTNKTPFMECIIPSKSPVITLIAMAIHYGGIPWLIGSGGDSTQQQTCLQTWWFNQENQHVCRWFMISNLLASTMKTGVYIYDNGWMGLV